MYKAELDKDQDEDDIEKATMTKQKGKLKMFNKNCRTHSMAVQEPNIILSNKGWTPHAYSGSLYSNILCITDQLLDFAGYSCKMYLIPLVIDTNRFNLYCLKKLKNVSRTSLPMFKHSDFTFY